MWGGLSTTCPGRLPLVKRPGTHCTGWWVCPRVRLDGCGKSRPNRIRPHPQTPQPVTSPYTDYAIPAHVLVKRPIFLSHFNIFGYSRQMVIKVSSIKFHENPSCGRRVGLYSCMRTDRRADGWTSMVKQK